MPMDEKTVFPGTSTVFRRLLLRPGLSKKLDYFGVAASLGTSQRCAITRSFDIRISALGE